jgi:hypothetical protein
MSKSNLVIKVIGLVFMPTSSILKREKILDISLMLISSGDVCVEDSNCFNELGAWRTSPPGKNTFNISRNRNTCSWCMGMLVD